MFLLILNVQVFSSGMTDCLLVSQEGILQDEQDTIIRIPSYQARLFNGGPVIGNHYSIRYMDGIENHLCGPEFYYLGIMDQQFIFSVARTN